MTMIQSLRRVVGDRARNSPSVYSALKSLENRIELYRHTAASIVPGL